MRLKSGSSHFHRLYVYYKYYNTRDPVSSRLNELIYYLVVREPSSFILWQMEEYPYSEDIL